MEYLGLNATFISSVNQFLVTVIYMKEGEMWSCAQFHVYSGSGSVLVLSTKLLLSIINQRDEAWCL